MDEHVPAYERLLILWTLFGKIILRMNALGLRSICQLVCLQVLYRKPSNHSYLQKWSKDVIEFCAYIILRKYHSITHMDFVWIKKRSKFNLVPRSNFCKTWKNYYIPEICKISKATQLRIHKTDTAVDFTFGRSFSALQKRTPSFSCYTCSSDVPLQTTRGLMG